MPLRSEKRRSRNGETRLVALRVIRSRRHFREAENPRAAVHVDERIANAARRLLDFPDSGRPGRVAGTRELVMPRTSYVAAYAIKMIFEPSSRARAERIKALISVSRVTGVFVTPAGAGNGRCAGFEPRGILLVLFI